MKHTVFGALALLLITQIVNAETQKNNESKAYQLGKVRINAEPVQTLKTLTPPKDLLTKKNLDELAITHSDQVWSLIPNLSTSSGTNRTRYIQIRGVGERSEYDSIPTTSIGFYYDHIDLSGTGGVSTTFDVEKIEILKGPQSYLYGDASIGGNILIKSSDPLIEQRKISIGAGSQNKTYVSLQVNKELSERFSFKLGVEKNRSEGFYKNTYLGKKTSGQNELFINAGTHFNYGPLELITRHIFANSKNGYDVWNAYAQDFTTFSDKPGLDHQKTNGHSLEVNLALDNLRSLTFIGSISNSDIFYSYDEDWGNNPFWNTPLGGGYNYNYNKAYDRTKQNYHTKLIYQHKLKLFLWTAGTHVYQRKEASDIISYKNDIVKEALNTDYSSNHFAVFTSAKTKLSANLDFNASLRFEKQHLQYSDSSSTSFINQSEKIESNLFGFNVGLHYSINTNNKLNFVYSRGFKGAGLNADTSLTLAQKKYSPESLLNYELSWAGTSKTLNHRVTVFYMNRNNQQISASAQNNPLDPSDFTVFTDNASKSENYGAELNALILPKSKFNADVTVGLLKARFKKYSREGIVYDGRDLAHAPEYTYSLRLNYRINHKFRFSLTGVEKGSFYFSNSHDQKSDQYFILNATASYQISKNLNLALWGRNILNQKYATRGFYFPNKPPWGSELYTQSGSPLEWGVNLIASF